MGRGPLGGSGHSHVDAGGLASASTAGLAWAWLGTQRRPGSAESERARASALTRTAEAPRGRRAGVLRDAPGHGWHGHALRGAVVAGWRPADGAAPSPRCAGGRAMCGALPPGRAPDGAWRWGRSRQTSTGGGGKRTRGAVRAPAEERRAVTRESSGGGRRHRGSPRDGGDAPPMHCSWTGIARGVGGGGDGRRERGIKNGGGKGKKHGERKGAGGKGRVGRMQGERQRDKRKAGGKTRYGRGKEGWGKLQDAPLPEAALRLVVHHRIILIAEIRSQENMFRGLRN